MPELVYINPKGVDGDKFVYEFIFSETPEIVYGKDWDYPNPSICSDLRPDETTYSMVKTVKTTYKLKTVQDTTCFSMEYAMERLKKLLLIILI